MIYIERNKLYRSRKLIFSFLIILEEVMPPRCMNVVYFVFFFQAEDGIRDHCVTGVQTCALPISMAPYHMSSLGPIESDD